jgi:hypothetical protein
LRFLIIKVKKRTKGSTNNILIKINTLIFLLFLITFDFYGQTIIKGSITNQTNQPIAFANAILKTDSTAVIVAYAYANDTGYFEIKTTKTGNFKLQFSALGYQKVVKDVIINNDVANITINAQLTEDTTTLDEVVIQSERPIRVKKDTIIFKASAFTDGTEQTVEDLLKKIPGLQIDSQGTIKVGNQEIEKLMIDGDDLFERGYKILSKNMPAHPIENVEVLQNYSNNRLLKGIEESDKVALNLTLDEKAKRLWFGNIDVAYGNDNFYEVRSNLMNFGKKNKYYFLTNLNNIGFDATGDINHLIRPYRMGEPGVIGDNQQVSNLLNLRAVNNNFKRSRTNFNNAELLSLNAIFNPTDKLKIKTLGFFNWDETDFFRNSLEVVNVGNTNFTNTEDLRFRNKSKLAFGKLDLTYNSSKTKMIEATTKYNNAQFNDGSNLIFNGNSTLENLKHQNNLIDQSIRYTNKFKDKKVFLLTGRFIDESSPQNYNINQFFYQDLFPDNQNTNNVAQQSKNQMQYAGVNAHLLDRKDNGNLLELQVGNEYRKDQLKTQFILLEDEQVLSQPNNYQNNTVYQVNNLYLKTKYRYKINDFGITAKLDAHQLFNSLDNNNNKTNEQPFFINPSLGFDWKINNKNKITASQSFNTSNAQILDVYSDFVLTGFRSFNQGTGSFNQLQSSATILNYQLGNWSDQFFANTFIMYTKNRDFFSSNTFISQNFTQSQKILIKDQEFFSINSNVDYYLKFLKSNLKANLGFTQTEFKNIVNDSDLRTVKSTNYNYGLELRSGFRGIFNYHFGTKWSTNKIETTISNDFTDNVSFLDLTFIFSEKLDLQIQTERYFFGNLDSDNNTYYFLDFLMRQKLIDKKLSLAITGKNLFNTEKFRTFSLSDIGSSTTEYRLLPRHVLLKLEYRF